MGIESRTPLARLKKEHAEIRNHYAAMLREKRRSTLGWRLQARTWHREIFGTYKGATFRAAWRGAELVRRAAEKFDVWSGVDDQQRWLICWAVAVFINLDGLRKHFESGAGRNRMRSRRRGIDNAIAKLKAIRPDMTSRLDELRIELLELPNYHWMHASEQQLFFGDVQHVLPLVLDRIYREGARCSATESNRRIATILHRFFEVPQRAQHRAARTAETGAIYKQLSRQRKSVSNPTKLEWQLPTWRWDPMLDRVLTKKAL